MLTSKVGFVTQINVRIVAWGEIHATRKINPGSNHDPNGQNQGQDVMIKTAYAVAVSAIAASLFVAFPSLSPQVGASAPIVGAKGDRADIRPLGTECGEKTWPYFDAACTR